MAQRFSDEVRAMLSTRNLSDRWTKPSTSERITITMQQFTALQNVVRKMADEVHAHFKSADTDSNMLVNIEVTNGRHEELEIKYTVNAGRYGGNPVTGNELAPALKEFFRRKGWDLQHNVKLISSS